MFNIGPMTEPEALLLLERLGTLDDPTVAVWLVQEIGYIPLAISQAASIIQTGRPLKSPSHCL